MAKASERVEARTKLLKYDHAMLDELLEITTEWNDLAEGEWISWLQDWEQVMLRDVPKLREYSVAGELTSSQEASYRRLLQRIEENRELIERFGLTMPQIPVET